MIKATLCVIRTTLALWLLTYLILWTFTSSWLWFLDVPDWPWYGRGALIYCLFLGLCGALGFEGARYSHSINEQMKKDYQEQLKRNRHGKGTNTL